MSAKSPPAPAVSIVIPYYNAERTLAETLASVAAQTRTDWELLLVDDGSTDAGPAAAAAFARGRPEAVRLLEHPARRGAFAARMSGARAAKAPVVALLDADDLWDPEYLEGHLALWTKAAARGAALSYGPASYWFPDDLEGARHYVHAMPSLSRRAFRPGELLQNFLSSGYATVPRTSCSLVKTSRLLGLAEFEDAARRFPLYEDQFLMWNLALRWPVAAHPNVWVRYRQRHALAARPKDYLERTLRDEAGFLPIMLGELRRRRPDHALLGPTGIPGRLASLRAGLAGGAWDAFFFKRIPPELKRLTLA